MSRPKDERVEQRRPDADGNQHAETQHPESMEPAPLGGKPREPREPRAYPDPVDATLDDSFPASDPPSWSGGTGEGDA